MYRNIKFSKVSKTLLKLKQRVAERFPKSGLLGVCNELILVFNETESTLFDLSRPNYWLRGLVASIISLAIFLIYFSFTLFEFESARITFAEVLQIFESAVNDIILGGLAIFFLISLESKLKRKKALSSLNQLRAISHIVDMHQLTKDPTEIGDSRVQTESSPKRNLTPFELRRYLDYCSELLAIVGKIAALYAQSLPDAAINSTVNEIESLTSGISRKVWQKIVILQSVEQK